MDNPGLKQLTAALKARLFYAETKGGDYSSGNANSSAVGKYQFLWDGKWPWGPEIQKFAKKSGYGDNISKEDFRNNPDLQEEFFEKEYMPKVYSFVNKNKSNNKRNLDMDEIAQLYHLHPAQAKQYIEGGTFDAGGKNMGAEAYLKEGVRGMIEFGGKPVKESSFLDNEKKQIIVNDYLFQAKEIQNGDFTDGAKKMKMRQLKQTLYDEGLTQHINSELGKRSVSFDNDKKLFQEVFGVIQKNIKSNNSGNKKYWDLNLKTEKEKKIIDVLLKEHPELKNSIRKSKNGNYKSYLGLGKNPINKFIVDGVNKYAGKNISNISEIIHDKQYKVSGAVTGALKSLPGYAGGIGNALEAINLGDNPNDDFVEIDFNVENKDAVNFNINQKDITTTPKVYDNKIAQEAIVEKTTAENETPQPGTIEVSNVQDAQASEEAEFDKFLNDNYLEAPQDLVYDKKDFAAEIPFEAVAGAFVGLQGLEQSNEGVPLRNEQISQGVLDYAAKIAKISQIGLPPELEAKLKNNAASSYSVIMNNIVEASGGNRNLVLGNQGQADYNRLSAANDIEIADYEEKQRGLQQYGEIQQYINEFDSRRDIDNTKIKQSVAFDRRDTGRDFASAGFSSLIQSLNDSKENGPGSAGHILMSQIRQKAFGFDPDMKDDGSGTKKGTESYYRKHVTDPIEKNNKSLDYIKETKEGFNDGQNKFLNLVQSKSSNVDTIERAVRFAKDNDLSRVQESQIGQAIQDKDFQSLLFNEVKSDNFVTEKRQEEYSNLDIS